MAEDSGPPSDRAQRGRIDADRVARLIGQPVIAWRVRTEGLTNAAAGLADLVDGSTVFVKAATDPASQREVATEIDVLQALRMRCLPRLIAADPTPPATLVLEDLSAGTWPEPYPADLRGLSDALAEIRSTVVPDRLDLRTLRLPDSSEVQRNLPAASVSVPAMAEWCVAHGERLAAAVGALPGGDSLVHTDLWYSNICFLAGRVVVVDWSHAARGPAWFDTSTVNVDLVIEGRRPLPIPEPAGWAALHLYWGLESLRRGPGSAISDPDRWRLDNLELVEGAAWWAAHELDLPDPPRLTSRHPGWR